MFDHQPGKKANYLQNPGQHCPSCYRRHTKACIDGGRCVFCGTALLPYNPAAEPALPKKG
jgi:hypothetical protein